MAHFESHPNGAALVGFLGNQILIESLQALFGEIMRKN
jgi:hypothetical protein